MFKVGSSYVQNDLRQQWPSRASLSRPLSLLKRVSPCSNYSGPTSPGPTSPGPTSSAARLHPARVCRRPDFTRPEFVSGPSSLVFTHTPTQHHHDQTLDRTVQVESLNPQDLSIRPEVEPCSPGLMERQQLTEPLDPTAQLESLDLLDAIVGPEVQPIITQLITRPMETEQTAQVESLDFLDAIVGPEIQPSSPRISSRPMEAHQNENLDQIFVVTDGEFSELRPLNVLQGVVFQHDDITQVDSSLLDEDPMKLLDPKAEVDYVENLASQAAVNRRAVEPYIQGDLADQLLDSTAQVESLDMLDDIIGPEVERSSTQLSTSLMEIQQVDTLDVDNAMWSPATLETTSEPAVDGSLPHLCTASVTDPQHSTNPVAILLLPIKHRAKYSIFNIK